MKALVDLFPKAQSWGKEQHALPGPDNLPRRMKRDLDTACRKTGEKVRRVVPGTKNKAAAARYFNRQLCKDVDQRILKLIFKQLAAQAKKHSATEPDGTPKVVKTVPKMTPPGKGVPSVKIPVPWSIPLGEVTGNPKSEGKFTIEIWADPRSFEDEPKGGVLNFTLRY